MDIISGWRFSCVDPRKRTVRCGQDAWRHVIKDHSDLATAQHVVQEAIEHPDEIYFDADFDDRECYYRFDIKVHDVRCSLKVVVQFNAFWRVLGGAVHTVYEKYDVSPGRVKRGERRIWP